MQNKLLSIILFVFALFTLQVTYANSMPPKPNQCPSTSALRSGGIDIAAPSNDGTWLAGVLSNPYGTDSVWTFIIGDLPANNEEEALSMARTSLETLTYIQGPIAVPQYGVWACGYMTGQGYRAISITPPIGLKTAATKAAFQLIK